MPLDFEKQTKTGGYRVAQGPERGVDLMTITIHVTDPLANRLQRRASLQSLTPEQLALHILAEALEPGKDAYSTLDTVVAMIKATPPNSGSFRPARESLREALEIAPEDPDFDLKSWETEWAAIEQEMKTVSRANAMSEGRV